MLLVAVLGGVLVANLLHAFGLELPGSSVAVVAGVVGGVGWRLQAVVDRADGVPEPQGTEGHLTRAWRGVATMVRQLTSGLAGAALLALIVLLLAVRAYAG